MKKKIRPSLVVLMVKNLPVMQETQVCSPGQKNPLETEMATHYIFLPGEFHGQMSLVGYSSWSCKQSHSTEQLNTFAFGGPVVKNSPANAGDIYSIPGLGGSHMPWSN